MHVKCLKRGEGNLYDPDGVVHSVEQHGSALLSAFAAGEPSQISLDRTKGTALHILGGRSSIVHWLKLHGTGPVILNNEGGNGGPCELWATIFRKHRTLGKDLTLVSLHPYCNKTKPQGSWQFVASVPFHENPNSPGLRQCTEIWPDKLAMALQRRFELMGVRF